MLPYEGEDDIEQGRVERMEVSDLEVKMYYTIPMPPYGLPEETAEVIPFIHHSQRRGGTKRERSLYLKEDDSFPDKGPRARYFADGG